MFNYTIGPSPRAGFLPIIRNIGKEFVMPSLKPGSRFVTLAGLVDKKTLDR